MSITNDIVSVYRGVLQLNDVVTYNYTFGYYFGLENVHSLPNITVEDGSNPTDLNIVLPAQNYVAYLSDIHITEEQRLTLVNIQDREVRRQEVVNLLVWAYSTTPYAGPVRIGANPTGATSAGRHSRHQRTSISGLHPTDEARHTVRSAFYERMRGHNGHRHNADPRGRQL